MTRTMSVLRVRASYASIATSRPAITFLVFVIAMGPLAFGFLSAFSGVTNTTLRLLYGMSAALPLLGLLFAIVSLIVVVFRRRRTVLELGEEIHIVRTGVRLDPQQLECMQTWTRDFGPAGVRSYLALIPGHIDARMGAHPVQETANGAPRELQAYVAEFPPHVHPNVFEVVEYIRGNNPQVTIEKLGNIEPR